MVIYVLNFVLIDLKYTSFHVTLMYMVPVTACFDYYYIKKRIFS